MPHRLDIASRMHERLMEIVGVALPLIASSMADADLVGLAHLREEMVEAIDRYCRYVHALRDAARAAGDGGGAARTDELAAECAELRAAYEGFRTRWADRTAVEHWPEYRLSAIVMMKRVRACVRRAEALRRGRVSLAA